MSGPPPSFPGSPPPLPAPLPGEAWACLDLPGGGRLEGRGPFRSAAVPPEDRPAFYVNDFALTAREPWRVPALTGWETGQPSSSGPDNPPALKAVWELPDRCRFDEVFRQCMAGVKQRRLLKIVPASPVRGQSATDPALPLHALLAPGRIAGMGHAAGWSDGREGFAAITPEVLFELSGSRLTTMALAGTADAQHEADLRHGPKLAREHEIVVDELHRRLAGLGRVQLTAREVVPLGNVRHLRTRLTVDLPTEPKGQALNDLIHLLHPTPALGVSPRTPETMNELLGYRAHCGVPPLFGSPLGLVWPGGAVFLVAIRGVFWQDRTLYLPAGGGLVTGSQPDHEWEELELKRRWIRQAFNLDA